MFGICKLRLSPATFVQRRTAVFNAQFVRRSFSNSTAFETLQKRLPHVDFSTNPYELERHGRGESHHPTKRPDVIVTPTTVDDVIAVVDFCIEHRIALIPFGVGTSVEGHVCCLHGGISLDMRLFQSIEIPDVGGSGEKSFDPIATVGAGVTRMTLNEALRHTGLQFVVDPGADATLGGMVATGASGTTSVRYGTMRENILQVECVIPSNDGAKVVQTGTRALKNSAGYDLLSLLCGSEGTLGVITSVSVKLHPIPEHVAAATCVFDSLKHAAEAVVALKLCEIPLVRCELLDSMSIEAFNSYKSSKASKSNGINENVMEVKPTLFLEFHGPSEETLREQVHMTESICTDGAYGGRNFKYTSGEEERKALWSARHSLYYASLSLRPGARDALLTDACVPLSSFADLVEATARDVDELGVVGPCFGHAGDGNFHCILPVLDDDSDDYTRRIHQVNDNLIKRTLDVGGTCTGEHGVGYGKMKYLERQYGPGAVAMMKAIKEAIDPHGIMNPGKVVQR